MAVFEKCDSSSRPFSYFRLETQPVAEPVAHLLRQVQPHSRRFGKLPAVRSGKESIKHPREVLLRDANPFVANADMPPDLIFEHSDLQCLTARLVPGIFYPIRH